MRPRRRTGPLAIGCGILIALVVVFSCIGAIAGALGLNKAKPTATTKTTTIAAATATQQPTRTIALASTATATRTLPTATRIAPTPAGISPTSTAVLAAGATTPPRFVSGGLGLTQAEWEATYGKPNRDNGTLKSYADDRYLVIYLDGRIEHLERVWGDSDPKSIDFATGAIKPHLPRDAQFIRTYNSERTGNPDDLYHSNSLAPLFPAANFVGGEPGDFIIIYRLNTKNQVTSAVLGLGNNP